MITAKYTCKQCGLTEVEIQVPARQSPNSDVKDWVEGVVGQSVRRDHHRRSPDCTCGKVDLWIPIPKDEDLKDGEDYWIGKQL